ncbi:MAG: type II toxin-antitoxin system RelE/ParE family toxin [Cyclobacteriaceae bacterium]
MKSGYNIKWTDHALEELQETYAYLEEQWSSKELRSLSMSIEHKIKLISQNPYLFQAADKETNLRRAVVARLHSIYYRVKENDVEILSFFANRKTPAERKFI